MKWEKQITDWLHKYIDDVTDLEIEDEKITLKVNNQIIGILVIQKFNWRS